MTTTQLILLCMLSMTSVTSLLWLAWSDSKRRRSARKKNVDKQSRLAPTVFRRRIAKAVFLLPAFWLVMTGQWSLLLVWSGIVFVSGWLVTLGFSFEYSAEETTG